MQVNSGKLIAKTLRDKILDKLDNSEITSKEVNVLINEIGEIVVQLQTLYFAELHKAEKRIMHTINERFEELREEIRQKLAEEAKVVNVSVSPQIDTETLVNTVMKKLIRGL
jgi:chaperonin cofactor prefoldin